MFDLLFVRFLFVLILGCAAYFLQPLSLNPPIAAGAGVLFAGAVVLFEIRLQQASLRRLIGAAFGSVLGILGAYLISLVLNTAIPNSHNTVPFLDVMVLALMWYVG